MGTKWNLDGRCLVVEGIAKPYVDGSVDMGAHRIRSVKPVGSGKILVDLASGLGPQADSIDALRGLREAGYIDPAQKVTMAMVDRWVVLVTFEHQLPLGFTDQEVQKSAPGPRVVMGYRTLTIGVSGFYTRDDVDRAVSQLWTDLKRSGVVKGNCPKIWR